MLAKDDANLVPITVPAICGKLLPLKSKQLCSTTIQSKLTRKLLCGISLGFLWIPNTSCMAIIPSAYGILLYELHISNVHKTTLLGRSVMSFNFADDMGGIPSVTIYPRY